MDEYKEKINTITRELCISVASSCHGISVSDITKILTAIVTFVAIGVPFHGIFIETIIDNLRTAGMETLKHKEHFIKEAEEGINEQ